MSPNEADANARRARTPFGLGDAVGASPSNRGKDPLVPLVAEGLVRMSALLRYASSQEHGARDHISAYEAVCEAREGIDALQKALIEMNY